MKKLNNAINKMLASISALLIVLSVCPTFTLPVSASSVVNLSQGKPYTTVRYVNPSYPDTNNTELTDGVLASSSYKDANWTATTSKKTESGNEYDRWPLYSVTIDLQGDKSITEVSANFLKNGNYSINLPKAIKVFASEDGINWMKLSYLNNINNNVSNGKYTYGWHVNGTNGIAVDMTGDSNSVMRARYVRFDFEVSYAGNNFIDEITVKGYDSVVSDAARLYNLYKLEDDRPLVSGARTDYVQDMILVYQNPGYNWSQSDLKAHLTYVDTAGNSLDTLYDTVLFLAQTSEKQKAAGVSQAFAGENASVTIADWNWYLNRTFVGTSSDVYILNQTAKQVAIDLNDPDYKANLVVMIPYPPAQATNFGTVNGRTLNLSVEADWKYLIDWYCDTVLNYIDNGGYEYIDFKGFYWMNEYPDGIDRIEYTTAHVRALGYKSFWIPYFNSAGYLWNEDLGFDAIALQPNHLFNDPTGNTLGAGGTKVIGTVARLGAYAKNGVEMEMNAQMLSEVDYYNNGLDYFNGAVEYGFAGPGYYRPWYAGNQIIPKIAHSKVPRTRMMYDNIYKLIKGQYETQSYLSNVNENLLTGKSYSHNVTSWYSAATTDSSSTFLTDGVVGGKYTSGNFLGAKQDATITFDFGNEPISFKEIFIEVLEDASPGIKLPSSVTISYQPSADSNEWVPLYSGAFPANQSMFGSNYSYDAYGLKFDFVKNGSFLFVKEIMAYNEITTVSLDEPLFDNVNVLSGKTYTHNVTTFSNGVTKDASGTSLTDGVTSGSYTESNYLNAQQSNVSVEFNFGNTIDISEIYLKSLQSAKNSIYAPANMTVYCKQANSDEWYPIYSGNVAKTDFRIATDTPVTVTDLKFDINSNGDYIFLKEIEAYQAATGATTNGTISQPVMYPDIQELPGNLLLGEDYTITTDRYLSGYDDPNGTKLTDGVEAATYSETDDDGNRLNTALLLKDSNSTITFDFDAPKRIKEVELAGFNNTSAGVAVPSKVIVEVKNGNTWRQVVNKVVEHEGIARQNMIFELADESIIVEGLRFTFVLGTQSWFILDEIEAYVVRGVSATPVFTQNLDSSAIVLKGNQLSLSVVATSSDGGTLTYQWYKDNELIEGAKNATYTISQASASDAGSYKVIVKNTLDDAISYAESNACEITIINRATAPVFGTDLKSTASAIVGNTVTLNVAVTANGTLSYQWYKDGDIIANATGTSYTASESGSYYVVATNTLNNTTASTTSNTCVFSLFDSAPEPVIVTDLPKTSTFINGALKTLRIKAEADGELSYQWYKNDVAIEGATQANYVANESGSYKVAITNNLNGYSTTIDSGTCVITVIAVPDSVILGETYSDNIVRWHTNYPDTNKTKLTDGTFNECYGNVDVVLGALIRDQDLTFTFEFDTAKTFKEIQIGVYNDVEAQMSAPSNVLIEAIIDGVWTTISNSEIVEMSAEVAPKQILTFATNGRRSITATGLRFTFTKGTQNWFFMDEISAYSVKTGTTIDGKLALPGETVEVADVPEITTNLDTASSFVEGSQKTLTVVATANGDLSYQWYKDNVEVEGATADTYIVTEPGNYYVVVTNTLDDTTEIAQSNTCIVSILPKANVPTFTANLDETAVFMRDSSTVLTVEAAANGTLSYQWYKDGAVIENATNDNLTVSEEGSYYVVVTNTLNGTVETVTSKTCALTVIDYINILLGASYTTTVERYAGSYPDTNKTKLTDGVVAEVYSEEDVNVGLMVKNNPAIVTFDFVSAKNIKTVEISAFNYTSGAVAVPGQVIIEVKNGDTWTEKINATITKENSSRQVMTFDIAEEPISVEGLRLSIYKGEQSWVYLDEIEAYGDVTTATPADVPTITTNLSETASFPEGNSVTLTVSATGNGVLSYQWYKDGVEIENANKSTYTATEAGNYYVVVTNTLNGGVETVTSNTCVITVSDSATVPTFIIDLNTSASILENGSKVLTVEASGNGTITYQWYKDDVAIENATESTYTVTEGGSYYVVATNSLNDITKTATSNVCVVSVVDTVPFEAPVLTYVNETRRLTLNAGSLTNYNIAVAYIGKQTFDLETEGYKEFIEKGQEYSDINGYLGYVYYENSCPTKVYEKEGNYVVYIKYCNEDNKNVYDFYTFTVEYLDYTAPVLSYNSESKTLSVAKNDATSYIIAIAYIGAQSFDLSLDGWDEFVAKGKVHSNLNGNGGYVRYADSYPTKVYTTQGNYVGLIKYTNNEGITITDYMTFTVKTSDFTAPVLSFDNETNKLSVTLNDADSYSMGIAFIGGTSFEVGVDNWNEFLEKGKLYTNMNGYRGYVSYDNTCPTKVYTTKGNYVAYIKYVNEKGVTTADYMTFTVADTGYKAPALKFNSYTNQVFVSINDATSYKIGIAYIGNDTFEVGKDNWNEFVEKGKAYSDKNGHKGYVTYDNTYPTKVYKTRGNYVGFIKYTDDKNITKSAYMTFTIV